MQVNLLFAGNKTDRMDSKCVPNYSVGLCLHPLLLADGQAAMWIIGKIEKCHPDNAAKIHTSLRQTLLFASSIIMDVAQMTFADCSSGLPALCSQAVSRVTMLCQPIRPLTVLHLISFLCTELQIKRRWWQRRGVSEDDLSSPSHKE